MNELEPIALPPERTVVLSDGRAVGLAEYGDPAGSVLFALHGMPGSRLMFAALGEAARDASIRLVALDRPGYGLSEPSRAGTLLDYAADVAAVADSLGIASFGILGASGGAPYALACASRLADRVDRVGIVSGIGPLRTPGALDGMASANALVFRLARLSPRLVGTLLPTMIRRSLPSMEEAVAAGTSPTPTIPPRVLAVVVADQREAIRQGGAGIAFDAANLWRPWGFRFADLPGPVAFWHGDADTLAPVRLARSMAAEIPGAVATLYPGEGHAEPLVRHADEIVAAFTMPRALGTFTQSETAPVR